MPGGSRSWSGISAPPAPGSPPRSCVCTCPRPGRRRPRRHHRHSRRLICSCMPGPFTRTTDPDCHQHCPQGDQGREQPRGHRDHAERKTAYVANTSVGVMPGDAVIAIQTATSRAGQAVARPPWSGCGAVRGQADMRGDGVGGPHCDVGGQQPGDALAFAGWGGVVIPDRGQVGDQLVDPGQLCPPRPPGPTTLSPTSPGSGSSATSTRRSRQRIRASRVEAQVMSSGRFWNPADRPPQPSPAGWKR